MDEFHLLRPWWLLAIPLGFGLVYAFVRRLRSGERWQEVCDADLLPHLLVHRGTRGLPWPAAAMALGIVLASVALAGPTWESIEQPVFRSRDARVIVLDLSASMDAPDLKPSRLVRARFKAADILERTREGQSGLVVFAGDAFVVSPLTDDSKTLIATLPALTTSIVPVQGSRADRGLQRAFELLEQAQVKSAEVILISDGVDDFRAVQAAASLKQAGYRVSALAIGTAQGAPIPLADGGGGFLKDETGRIVVPHMNTRGLQEVARAGGGQFATVTADNADLGRLLGGQIGGQGRPETEATDREAETWRDEGPWLVLALLPIAALAFRRGWLLGVILVLCIPDQDAMAFGWADLWARPDQQAAAALMRGDPGAAAILAQTPQWRGTAQYRNREYANAADTFGQRDDATAHFNRGNALARSGRLRDALAAYEQALALDGSSEDATFNRDLVAALLEQRRSEEQKNQDSGQRDSQGRAGDSGDGERPENLEPVRDGDPRGEERAQDLSGGGDDSQAGSSQPDEAPSAQRSDAGQSSGGQERAGEARGRSGGSGTDLAMSSYTDEQRQAIEQWLRRIPEHPGGLLRQKFILDYDRRGRPDPDSARTW